MQECSFQVRTLASCGDWFTFKSDMSQSSCFINQWPSLVGARLASVVHYATRLVRELYIPKLSLAFFLSFKLSVDRHVQ
jgi:hypothetical protein